MHYNMWNKRYTDCKIQKYSYLDILYLADCADPVQISVGTQGKT